MDAMAARYKVGKENGGKQSPSPFYALDGVANTSERCRDEVWRC